VFDYTIACRILLCLTRAMGYLLYKYKETGYGSWVIVEIGPYQPDAIACVLKAFFPNGTVLARIESMTVFEPGVVTDINYLCSPKRFHDPHTIDMLRKAPRELVARLLDRWETHDNDDWKHLVSEIRARVLNLS